MTNETREELFNIMALSKELNNKEDLQLRFKMLLQRFEYQIKEDKHEAQRKLEIANENLKILEAVKKEVEKNINM